MRVMVWFYNHRDDFNPLMDEEESDEEEDDDSEGGGDDDDDEEDEEDGLDQVHVIDNNRSSDCSLCHSF